MGELSRHDERLPKPAHDRQSLRAVRADAGCTSHRRIQHSEPCSLQTSVYDNRHSTRLNPTRWCRLIRRTTTRRRPTYTADMFTKRYPIEPHGRKRLTVSAGRTWSEVVVRLDGVELGRTDREGLLKGVEYPLRDHTSLRLWLEFGYRGAPRLFLTRNGRPLPGSAGDPSTILWTTLVIVWFFAALQLALAVLV